MNPRHAFVAFAGSPHEASANRFAADLLMPLWMLEPLVLSHGVDPVTLSRMFGVSEEAMNIRLGVLTGIRR
jgi:Zn-dependent peptidase ImmA (M78 family)